MVWRFIPKYTTWQDQRPEAKSTAEGPVWMQSDPRQKRRRSIWLHGFMALREGKRTSRTLPLAEGKPWALRTKSDAIYRTAGAA